MLELTIPRLAAAALLGAPLLGAGAQTPLTVSRIFRDGEFRATPSPSITWLRDGRSYVDVRRAREGGSDLVRIDLLTGDTTVLVEGARLVDSAGKRLDVEEVTLSADESQALLFHDGISVFRHSLRGSYHVVDLATKRARPLSRAPGQQMLAKFSPDGRQVGFVRDHDLWVADLASGTERRLTTDGGPDIINGTTDWVYEEEFSFYDAWRWSPDGRRIAFWRFDQSGVPEFPLVNELALYPRIATLRYPKAGAPNSAIRIGVMEVATASTRWMDIGGDTGLYVSRLSWLGTDSVLIQRLPRRQNRMDLLVASATTGAGRTLLVERDSAYVDAEVEPRWLAGEREFLWLSDRGGWRQVHLVDRRGRVVRTLSPEGMDVLSIVEVDEARGHVYAIAAAPTPTQRQLYRFALRGRAPRAERVTQAPGVHAARIGPGARYLVDTHSSLARPPRVTLFELPAMRERRVLVDNAALNAKLESLGLRAPEFFRLPSESGVMLDAYRIVPPDFDSTRKHPVLMYVYGGPAAPVVNDGWIGNRYLWHQLLARQGYVVVAVDNRGAAWRGRDFRKITQLRLGQIESTDQIAAARWLASRPWVDGARIGIWGWSYGGYLSSLTAMLGGEQFRAAIAVAPVTDWRLYDTIYTERFMWLPSANAEGYSRGAPLAHVDSLRAVLLVAHGTGDDNVHVQNTLMLADRLERAGKPFSMLLYPNRAHGISDPPAQAHLHEAMLRFLEENLGDAGTGDETVP
jgi:dipeptidyl-peptidase-4